MVSTAEVAVQHDEAVTNGDAVAASAAVEEGCCARARAGVALYVGSGGGGGDVVEGVGGVERVGRGAVRDLTQQLHLRYVQYHMINMM